MPAGVLPKLRKMGATMKYFGLHPTGNKYDVWQVDTSGNFDSLALKLTYGKMN